MTNSSRVLKVGIVGLGHLHPRLYMPLFEDNAQTQVVVVFEADTELRSAFARDYTVRGYETLADMLNAEQLDIAAIFLPHVDCPDAAVACAERGIHLMVEKPMAASATQAARIVEAARKAQVKLTTGYAWRTHPAALEIKRLIDAGVLGRIVGAEGRIAAGRVHRYIEGKSPWMLQKARSGGGPMYNLGVHWIDLLTWLLDDKITEVSGRNVKVNDEYDIEDNSFAHLQFAGGMIAALDISYTVPDAFPNGRDLYLSLRGTQGVISWAPGYEGESDELFICSDAPSCAGAGRRRIQFELDPVKGYSGCMGVEYLRGFVRAIIDDTDVPIDGSDGVTVLQVVEAIYRADAEKRWIPVS